MDNIELVPLKLITSNRDAIRKTREAFLISKGKTKFDLFIFLFFYVYISLFLYFVNQSCHIYFL